jgi:hypothetical protein
MPRWLPVRPMPVSPPGYGCVNKRVDVEHFHFYPRGGVFWVLRKPGIQRCFSIPPSPYWPDVPSVPWYKQTDPRQHNNSLSPVHGVELFSLDYEEGTLSYFYLSSLIPSRAGFVCLPHAARIWVYPLGPICRPHIWPTTARYQSLPFKAACSL